MDTVVIPLSPPAFSVGLPDGLARDVDTPPDRTRLLPGELSLPPVAVRRNRERRRRDIIRAKKARAEEVYHLARAAIRARKPDGLPLAAGLIRATWHCRGVPPDPDNVVATLKWDLDALRHANVIEDDAQVYHLPPIIIATPGERPRLILDLYAATFCYVAAPPVAAQDADGFGITADSHVVGVPV